MVDYAGSEGVRSLELQDVSPGGLRLVTDAAEIPGASVTLQLTFGSDEVIEVSGQVIWARQSAPYEVGVSFVDLDAERTAMLHRLCETLPR